MEQHHVNLETELKLCRFMGAKGCARARVCVDLPQTHVSAFPPLAAGTEACRLLLTAMVSSQTAAVLWVC